MAAVYSRYARAFVEVVLDQKLDAAKALSELRSLIEVVDSSSDLRQIWQSPAVPADQKRKVLDAIVARLGVGKPVRNFLAVLIDHHRSGALAEITRQFERELDARLGLAEADVTSARELSPDEKRTLESQVEQLTGKKVRARYATDTTLLGGAVVRLGSTIYDGSVRGRLQKLKEQLSAG